MKKFFLTAIGCLALVSVMCACSNKEEVKEEKVAEKKEVVQEVIQSKVDPEIEKLNKVLMSMSERCKEAIPIGDPKEFLNDLYKVLDAEKNYPQDEDSSLFLQSLHHLVYQQPLS